MEAWYYAVGVMALIVLAVAVIYVLVARAARHKHHLYGTRETRVLSALATGGVSLLAQDTESAHMADRVTRKKSYLGLILDAFATGGVSLIADSGADENIYARERVPT